MKKYLLAASAAAFIVASGAHAADVVSSHESASATVAPAFSWQGFYIGGQIGGSWADADYKVKSLEKTFSPDPDGFIGGLYAGYNFDAGNNIILGVETDFIWSDMNDSSRYNYDADLTSHFGVKQEWQGATRVRAGYAMDRFLPYIAAGVAYGKVKATHKFTDAVDPENNTGWSDDDTHTGWTIGAGVDYAVTDNVLVRLEYRYSDLGDKSYRFDNSGERYKIDYKTNDVRVGVAYKF